MKAASRLFRLLVALSLTFAGAAAYAEEGGLGAQAPSVWGGLSQSARAKSSVWDNAPPQFDKNPPPQFAPNPPRQFDENPPSQFVVPELAKDPEGRVVPAYLAPAGVQPVGVPSSLGAPALGLTPQMAAAPLPVVAPASLGTSPAPTASIPAAVSAPVGATQGALPGFPPMFSSSASGDLSLEGLFNSVFGGNPMAPEAGGGVPWGTSGAPLNLETPLAAAESPLVLTKEDLGRRLILEERIVALEESLKKGQITPNEYNRQLEGLNAELLALQVREVESRKLQQELQVEAGAQAEVLEQQKRLEQATLAAAQPALTGPEAALGGIPGLTASGSAAAGLAAEGVNELGNREFTPQEQAVALETAYEKMLYEQLGQAQDPRQIEAINAELGLVAVQKALVKEEKELAAHLINVPVPPSLPQLAQGQEAAQEGLFQRNAKAEQTRQKRERDQGRSSTLLSGAAAEEPRTPLGDAVTPKREEAGRELAQQAGASDRPKTTAELLQAAGVSPEAIAKMSGREQRQALFTLDQINRGAKADLVGSLNSSGPRALQQFSSALSPETPTTLKEGFKEIEEIKNAQHQRIHKQQEKAERNRKQELDIQEESRRLASQLVQQKQDAQTAEFIEKSISQSVSVAQPQSPNKARESVLERLEERLAEIEISLQKLLDVYGSPAGGLLLQAEKELALKKEDLKGIETNASSDPQLKDNGTGTEREELCRQMRNAIQDIENALKEAHNLKGELSRPDNSYYIALQDGLKQMQAFKKEAEALSTSAARLEEMNRILDTPSYIGHKGGGLLTFNNLILDTILKQQEVIQGAQARLVDVLRIDPDGYRQKLENWEAIRSLAQEEYNQKKQLLLNTLDRINLATLGVVAEYIPTETLQFVLGRTEQEEAEEPSENDASHPDEKQKKEPIYRLLREEIRKHLLAQFGQEDKANLDVFLKDGDVLRALEQAAGVCTEGYISQVKLDLDFLLAYATWDGQTPLRAAVDDKGNTEEVPEQKLAGLPKLAAAYLDSWKALNPKDNTWQGLMMAVYAQNKGQDQDALELGGDNFAVVEGGDSLLRGCENSERYKQRIGTHSEVNLAKGIQASTKEDHERWVANWKKVIQEEIKENAGYAAWYRVLAAMGLDEVKKAWQLAQAEKLEITEGEDTEGDLNSKEAEDGSGEASDQDADESGQELEDTDQHSQSDSEQQQNGQEGKGMLHQQINDSESEAEQESETESQEVKEGEATDSESEQEEKDQEGDENGDERGSDSESDAEEDSETETQELKEGETTDSESDQEAEEEQKKLNREGKGGDTDQNVPQDATSEMATKIIQKLLSLNSDVLAEFVDKKFPLQEQLELILGDDKDIKIQNWVNEKASACIKALWTEHAKNKLKPEFQYGETIDFQVAESGIISLSMQLPSGNSSIMDCSALVQVELKNHLNQEILAHLEDTLNQYLEFVKKEPNLDKILGKANWGSVEIGSEKNKGWEILTFLDDLLETTGEFQEASKVFVQENGGQEGFSVLLKKWAGAQGQTLSAEAENRLSVFDSDLKHWQEEAQERFEQLKVQQAVALGNALNESGSDQLEAILPALEEFSLNEASLQGATFAATLNQAILFANAAVYVADSGNQQAILDAAELKAQEKAQEIQRQEQERLEQERQQREEKEKLEQEERERREEEEKKLQELERERLQKEAEERVEQERLAQEAREKEEKERAEQERREQEKEENERKQREAQARQDKERQEKELVEAQERAQAQQLQKDRLAAEREQAIKDLIDQNRKWYALMMEKDLSFSVQKELFSECKAKEEQNSEWWETFLTNPQADDLNQAALMQFLGGQDRSLLSDTCALGRQESIVKAYPLANSYFELIKVQGFDALKDTVYKKLSEMDLNLATSEAYGDIYDACLEALRSSDNPLLKLGDQKDDASLQSLEKQKPLEALMQVMKAGAVWHWMTMEGDMVERLRSESEKLKPLVLSDEEGEEGSEEADESLNSDSSSIQEEIGQAGEIDPDSSKDDFLTSFNITDNP